MDRSIPFTILAFFPEYRMKEFARPAVWEMIEAYNRVKATGLENIRLENVRVFAPTKVDQEHLMLVLKKVCINKKGEWFYYHRALFIVENFQFHLIVLVMRIKKCIGFCNYFFAIF